MLVSVSMIAWTAGNSWSELLTDVLLEGKRTISRRCHFGIFGAQGEQSGTESQRRPCHHEPAGDATARPSPQNTPVSWRRTIPQLRPPFWEKDHRVELMEPISRQLGNHLRRALAFIRTFFPKPGRDVDDGPMFGKDLKSQRMCPFCGLITSSYKTCCLECGKSLKPA
jgi:hypothetical protein